MKIRLGAGGAVSRLEVAIRLGRNDSAGTEANKGNEAGKTSAVFSN
ncbi:MAG TPA: hypothetical protein VK846_11700 [Candidatus Limnocylindria bacterium]|nr:hypothetical protein [Candidatus Limnocylindria bacterium]